MARKAHRAEGQFGKRQGHDLKRVTRTLATGERRTYLYYRPTMTRLRSAPGTVHFDEELESLRRGRTRPTAGTEYVYFIHAPAADAVKIGRAADPHRRLQILQVGSPHELRLIGWMATTPDERLERDLHGLFKADRIRGEWFTATVELLKFVQDRARL